MADMQTRRDPSASASGLVGVSPYVLLLRKELQTGAMETVAELDLRGRRIEVRSGSDALWAIIRRAKSGGLALRLAHAPGGCLDLKTGEAEKDEAIRLEFTSGIGRHVVALSLDNDEVPVMRATSWITPSVPLLMPFLPRDLYPLGEGDDPTRSRGQVEAAQRGLNSGLCYFRLWEPEFGSTLYFQDLSTLNPWFKTTGTKPDGAVGGEWPELGYLPPTPHQSGHPALNPLPADQQIRVSDALLAFHDESGDGEAEMARRYLSLLGAVYRRIQRPAMQFHDWVDRAERALRDIDKSPKATIRHYGFRYLHPYTDAEYPDSMVQLSVLSAIRDYEAWKKEPIPLLGDLKAGLRKFYDPKLRTLRRYLPNVGKDKDKDAVDSWYLYHPLLNLARLALDGDGRAKRLFLDSVEFGIKAAHHFKYKWPIQYKVTDFSVIQESRDEEGLGQTDVGGIYAYVMLEAFALTDDKRFVDEARTAIDATRGMRFELNYQANITAWGAAACLRLWRITNDEIYLRQSYVFVASFFHNTAIWESEIGHAAKYSNFLGVTALHDAPYMALYECFDSFTAFECYLKDCGPDVDPSVRLLLSEYCRYALDRAWYYYPDALPPEAISPTQRETNGHIDRALSFPVEDLYVDGQQAGQVGQEVYGAGAAFVFASRCFHTVRDAPFRIFCDHFLLASERPADRSLSFQLGGGEGFKAMVALLPVGRAALPEFTVTTRAGQKLAGRHKAGRIEYVVPADSRITIAW